MTECDWCGDHVEAGSTPALCEDCFAAAQREGRR